VRAGSMLEMFRTKTQQDRDIIVSKLVAIAGVMNVKYDSVSTVNNMDNKRHDFYRIKARK
jgi:hypothetical protein